jgi:hypothetical protein
MTRDSNAIGAVTEALWHLLHRELGDVLPGIKITARSPDKAREDGADRQLNLFLYHVIEDRSRATAPLGNENLPHLTLNLYYLVSAYGADDQEINSASHLVLAEAMRVLYRHPLVFLRPQGALDPVSVHVALHASNIDDLCKLWTAFQIPYQLSVVYEVSSVPVGDATPTNLSG